jgi:hypothetical protein
MGADGSVHCCTELTSVRCIAWRGCMLLAQRWSRRSYYSQILNPLPIKLYIFKKMPTVDVASFDDAHLNDVDHKSGPSETPCRACLS